jgi:DNA polymerase-3 subunit alpha
MSHEYVHLHRHDSYSLFDGYGTAKRAAKYAASRGMPALGLTNHGNVCGLIEHYYACKAENVKPILGIEAYAVSRHPAKGRKKYHVTLIALDASGWRNMMRLVEDSNRESAFYQKPTVTVDQLLERAGGIACLTGCGAGMVAATIRKVGQAGAVRLVSRLQEGFGDRLYVELQSHQYGDQREMNDSLLALAWGCEARTVITHDAHFVEADDYNVYQRMMDMHRGEGTADGREPFYMATAKEALEMSGLGNRQFVEALVGTNDVAKRVTLELEGMQASMPEVPDAVEKLRSRVADWSMRVINENPPAMSRAYTSRIKQELDIVEANKFSSYFLVVADIVAWAIGKGIGTGIGRGSVCGSMLAYALNITKVDPIKWNVGFERFLRLDKKAAPDIDLDFDSAHQDRVVEYAVRTYKARPICTFGYYRHRNLVNDLCRAYGEGWRDRLSEFELGDPEYEGEVFDAYRKTINQVRYVGSHPGGVVLLSDKEQWMAPMMRIHDGYKASFDLYSVERIGALKIDLLGLDTVGLIARLEKKTKRIVTEFDDSDIFGDLSEGKGEGVFQLEERGAREVCKLIKPESIEELAVCISLNRPAPLALGLVEKYAERKGRKPKGAFADTRGVTVYQDQVWQLSTDIGMSLADADRMMKLMKGDHPEWRPELGKQFAAMYAKFKDTTKQRGREMFDSVTQYGFNKAHAVAYALTGYVTAWYKRHFPVEFAHAHLVVAGRSPRRYKYEKLAVFMGIPLLVPHVNGPATYAIEELDGDKYIRRGLLQVKGVGPAAVDKIVTNAPYNGLTDFEEKSGVNKAVFNSLREAGALEWDEDKQAERSLAYMAWLRRQH